jgi:hypothetical protein
VNGAEHYREAEELLEHSRQTSMLPEHQTAFLLAAQVHATLALAAATALRDSVGARSGWAEVTR